MLGVVSSVVRRPAPVESRVDEWEWRPTVLPAVLGVSVFLFAWGMLHYGFYTHRLLLDTPLYERYGDAMLSGQMPYRDFSIEYPPGALPVFLIPSIFAGAGHFGLYSRVFEALMGLCGMLATASVATLVARRRTGSPALVGSLGLAGLGALALGPVVLSRFDLWPAALTVAALAALLGGRRRLAFALLGLGFAAKIYPAVMLPPMLVYVWRERGRRCALLCAATFLAVGLAPFLPFLALAPGGVWSSIAGQATRPLQIESLGASLLLGAHQVSKVRITMLPSHGSDNLVGALPHGVALGQAVLQAAIIVALWVGFARGRPDPDRLLRICAASVCAFVAFGKVLSPQYLVWLITLVALLRGRRALTAGACLLTALVLTQLWFPYRYLDLVYSLDPTASWLVLTRDLVLVALLGVLSWPESRANARLRQPQACVPDDPGRVDRAAPATPS
jgi:hypothetical protein